MTIFHPLGRLCASALAAEMPPYEPPRIATVLVRRGVVIARAALEESTEKVLVTVLKVVVSECVRTGQTG
jgi:hypothetical protein